MSRTRKRRVAIIRMDTLLGNWLALTSASVLLLWMLLKIGIFSRKRINNLHEKAVLITGSTGDFGSQLVKRLDSLGVTVYAGARSPDGAIATRLKEACSSRLHFLKLDVTRDEDIAEAVETVKSTLGDKKLWAVVNNAGIAHYAGFEWTSMETVKKIMDTNVLGTIRVTTAFLPLLKESCGRVVIVSSVAGHHNVPGISVYCASKSALIGFGNAIRRELQDWHVSVHLISPYLYRTNMSNPKNLERGMEENWKTGNSLRSSYPSTYLVDFKKRLAIFLKLAESEESVLEVIDDIVDAVIGLSPKISYFPGIIAKVFHCMVSLLPATAMDYVYSLIAPPTRQGERNRALDFLYARLINGED